MWTHQHTDPLVLLLFLLLLHSEGWMAFLSARSAACSAARPVPAASRPSSPSCPPSPPTRSSPTQRRALPQRGQRGHRTRGHGAEHPLLEAEGPGMWKVDGSFTCWREQSTSTRRGSWTWRRCSSPDPAGGTKSAACTFAVSLMPGRECERFTFLVSRWFISSLCVYVLNCQSRLARPFSFIL